MPKWIFLVGWGLIGHFVLDFVVLGENREHEIFVCCKMGINYMSVRVRVLSF